MLVKIGLVGLMFMVKFLIVFVLILLFIEFFFFVMIIEYILELNLVIVCVWNDFIKIW